MLRYVVRSWVCVRYVYEWGVIDDGPAFFHSAIPSTRFVARLFVMRNFHKTTYVDVKEDEIVQLDG
jgi:hypothetical protein